MNSAIRVLTFCLLSFLSGAHTQEEIKNHGQSAIDSYFRQRTHQIEAKGLRAIKTLDDWESKREEFRRQFREMLGLDPLPERTPLHATITGRIEHEDLTVEKLHFQSMPGLYVSANLYLPKNQTAPAPSILYVCGHATAKEGAKSLGNKGPYHHHGVWFAKHGYACLIIDTVQLGEIEGLHHGTYREGMWWWNSRGYTPGGVETWNSVRALDYLETRPEIDMTKIGMTGRSGGGAYSWFTAAIDKRVSVVVPVAGITDLHNHVVDGTVEGHCDCMFMVNTYGWDFAQVAALVAPRPLLIANSDKDTIFPLNGVLRVHSEVKKIYQLLNATDNLGLLITEGPHRDTQELRIPTFRWFNRFLKNDLEPIAVPALKRFSNKELSVFEKLPEESINATIQESFVGTAPSPKPPHSELEWSAMKELWLNELKEKTFRSWPSLRKPPPLNQTDSLVSGNWRFASYEFQSHEGIVLPIFVLISTTNQSIGNITVEVLSESTWPKFANDFYNNQPRALQNLPSALKKETSAHVWFPPRGIGPTAWGGDKRHQTHIRRRFMLLGETLDSMRVFDIVKGLQALRTKPQFKDAELTLQSEGEMSVNTLYAALYIDRVSTLRLSQLPSSQNDGPDYLNVLRIWDLPEAIACVLERTNIEPHRVSLESRRLCPQYSLSTFVEIFDQLQISAPQPLLTFEFTPRALALSLPTLTRVP